MAKDQGSPDYGRRIRYRPRDGGAAARQGLEGRHPSIAMSRRSRASRQHGRTAAYIATLDVTDERAVERVVGEVAQALGGISGVVNSAGIAADKHVFDTPVELFRKMLDVNVIGTFIVGRAAARIMKDNGGGAIVNIASISGLRGSKGRAPTAHRRARSSC